jgi:hypothetical protein
MAFLHVSEWDLRCSVGLLPAACATRRNTPRDMAFLHVYIRMGSSGAPTTSSRRNIHPGTWHSMYISEWDLRCSALLLPAACATREKYRDMAFLHVYIRMGSTRFACDYYQQLVPQGEIQGHGIPPCIQISEWDLHGAATSYYSLCHKGEISPRDMAFLHVYIRMGSTRCMRYYQQLVPPGIYTQGHGIPPCIYQNGIYSCRH